MKSALWKFGTLAIIGPVLLSGCQRSGAFKRDQDYYKPEGESYYDRGKKGATGRIALLGQPKKRVVVLNFWNDTPVRQNDIGNFAADELRRGLFQSQKMILPADARSDLGTEDFVQGDKVKVSQLIREGRRMGVAMLVVGRVTKVVFRQRGDDIGVLRQKQSMAGVDVELKVFDVAGGREILSTGRSGDAASNAMVAMEEENLEAAEYRAELTKLAIRNAMTQLIPDVVKSVEKMTWEGRIAKLAGNKIYLNAGKTSGLVAGDILKVLTPGDDVYDPVTGAYLGRSQGQLKGTLEVVDFIGPDGAVSNIHTGGNFQEGDSVQLY